jgi:hypothetical protein
MSVLKKQIEAIVSEELSLLKELDHRHSGTGLWHQGFPEEPVSLQANAHFEEKLAKSLSFLDKTLSELKYVIEELESRNRNPGNLIQLRDQLVENQQKLAEMLSAPEQW